MRVALAGFGSEGLSAYRYFAKQDADITIFDEADTPKQVVPDGAKFVGGQGAFSKLNGYDLVVRFPGIRPDRLQTDGEITSNIKEFFKACPTKNIIGVTGTKGKGTMASLTHNILREAGLRVHLAGNIGVPALDILDDIQPGDIVVLELSSFQLWNLDQSPHVAIVGMIEPEHLEVHRGMAEYVGAKANIVKWQTVDDLVIYHPTNKFSAQIAQQSAGTKIRYNTPEGAYIADGQIVMGGVNLQGLLSVEQPHSSVLSGPAASHLSSFGQALHSEPSKEYVDKHSLSTGHPAESISGDSVGRTRRDEAQDALDNKRGGSDRLICATAEVQIPGPHNLDNICAALTAAWQYTQNAAAAKKAITEYTGLEHRLEFVREVGGVKFYDDSISTTPGSVIAAMRSFDPAHEILIIGGRYDKGADFSELAREIAAQNPKRILFIGPIGAQLQAAVQAAGYSNGELHEEWTLADITARTQALATEGDVVILTPAVASFGDFANYKERGKLFKETVKNL